MQVAGADPTTPATSVRVVRMAPTSSEPDAVPLATILRAGFSPRATAAWAVASVAGGDGIRAPSARSTSWLCAHQQKQKAPQTGLDPDISIL